MAGKRTFTMIKPSAVSAHLTGPIITKIEEAGFRIMALKLTHLTSSQASGFYQEHEGKPFFPKLVEFMSSGHLIAMILEKDNAVEDFRKLIGATDPKAAAPGTIRNLYGISVTENAIHASDSDENALREERFFFSLMEQY